MKPKVRAFIASLLTCIFLIPFLAGPCQAIEQTEYSLQIKITVSCIIPVQSFPFSPVVVTVEVRNIGNETFNGTLTIDLKTNYHSYNQMEHSILNLTKDAVQSFSSSFSTDDPDRYYATIGIEPNQTSSNIKLYQESELVDEGFRVSAKDSIYLYPLGLFLALLGIVVTAIVGIVGIIYARKRKK